MDLQQSPQECRTQITPVSPRHPIPTEQTQITIDGTFRIHDITADTKCPITGFPLWAEPRENHRQSCRTVFMHRYPFIKLTLCRNHAPISPSPMHHHPGQLHLCPKYQLPATLLHTAPCGQPEIDATRKHIIHTWLTAPMWISVSTVIY